MKEKKWINFARYSNQANCIGKGRILELSEGSIGPTENGAIPRKVPTLHLKISLDGVPYSGTLFEIQEDEEDNLGMFEGGEEE
jgi:hypothetical protein